jgi:hypothetical protein
VADIDTLAAVALNEPGRRVLAEASAYLAEVGPERFGERYPDLADDFSDEAPSPIMLLLGVGQAPYPVTIGWCDWSGEDDPGQVRYFVDTACGNLGLTPPAWDSGTEERVITELGPGIKVGVYVPALLIDIDAQLRPAGLRLLLIDTDSDTYQFVPVTAETFSALDGTEGDGYTLGSAASLGAAAIVPPTPPAAAGTSADPGPAPVEAPQATAWAAPGGRRPGLYARHLDAEYEFVPAPDGRGTLRAYGPPPGPQWRPDGWSWVLEVATGDVELFLIQ